MIRPVADSPQVAAHRKTVQLQEGNKATAPRVSCSERNIEHIRGIDIRQHVQPECFLRIRDRAGDYAPAGSDWAGFVGCGSARLEQPSLC